MLLGLNFAPHSRQSELEAKPIAMKYLLSVMIASLSVFCDSPTVIAPVSRLFIENRSSKIIVKQAVAFPPASLQIEHLYSFTLLCQVLVAQAFGIQAFAITGARVSCVLLP